MCFTQVKKNPLRSIKDQPVAKAHYCLSGCDTSDSYGKKLLLFLKWKCMDAKAVAYCYHVDKGGEPINHISAAFCLSAAYDLLAEGKGACLSFCLANPITRLLQDKIIVHFNPCLTFQSFQWS